MPTITLNKTVFEKLVGKKLPLAELKDRISMLGTDLERIEDNEIVVEVFPNRPDMLSEQGFARAFSSFIGQNTGLKEYASEFKGGRVIIDKNVSAVRPYTACALVRNLKFNYEKIQEVIQIQEKLHITFGRHRKKAAIGIYPLEHITLPISYKTLPKSKIKFCPLEASGEMTAEQILEHHPTGKKYGHLLEGHDNLPVFIDAAGEILSMPPIINSNETGRITESTTDVFIECSGHDFKTLSLCLNMIVTALADMGGQIEQMELEYPDKTIRTPELISQEMKLDVEYANSKLGLNISKAEAIKLLERMGYGVEDSKVFVPCYRTDVLHPMDLVEDIAIAYGYENFTAQIPKIATVAEESTEYKFCSKLAKVFVGFGFNEVLTYHLSSIEHQTTNMLTKRKLIELLSSVNEEYNVLRSWLMPGLLNTFVINKHHEYPQKIFEMGTVFSHSTKTETRVQEDMSLCCMITHHQADFTEARQYLDALMKSLGLNYNVKTKDIDSFIPGRSAAIVVANEEIGILGELHPEVLFNFELSLPVAGFEINIKKLIEKL